MPIEDQMRKNLHRSPALLDSAISQRVCSFSPVQLKAKTQFKQVNLLLVEANTWGKDVCVLFFFLKDGSLSILGVDTSLCRCRSEVKGHISPLAPSPWRVSSAEMLCNAGRVAVASPDMTGRDYFTSDKMVPKVEGKKRLDLLFAERRLRPENVSQSALGGEVKPDGGRHSCTLLLLLTGGWFLSVSNAASISVTNVCFGRWFWGDTKNKEPESDWQRDTDTIQTNWTLATTLPKCNCVTLRSSWACSPLSFSFLFLPQLPVFIAAARTLIGP